MALRHLLLRSRLLNTRLPRIHTHHLLPPISFPGFQQSSFNLFNLSSSSSYHFTVSHHHESSIPTLPCTATCVYKGSQKDDWIIRLAMFAVDQHNQNHDKQLEFVRVVGASHTKVTSLLYHITLEAVGCKKQRIYHVVVWMLLWKNLMELLEWKPIHDDLSAVGVKHGDLKLHEIVMFQMSQVKRYRI